MKKRGLVSLILAVCMIMNLATFVFADGELVSQKKLIGNTLTVTGYGDKVNIFLLNPGKTVSDLNNAVTDAEFDAVVNYCNTVSPTFSNKYSDTFEIMNVNEEATYKLYVKEEDREYISDIRMSNKIYVSGSASENGDGSKAKPYKTIEAARDAIAKMDLDSSIEVIIAGGEYKINNHILFDESNSGTKDYSITYKSADGEKVVLSGTTRLDTSKVIKVTDEKILNKVDKNARGKLVEIDLAEQGISKTIVDFNAKLSVGSTGKPMRLFLNGAQQDLARWPNAGYELIKTSEGGGNRSQGTTELGGATIGIENLDSKRAARWENAKDMYIEGYLNNGWHEEWAEVGSIDTENAKVKLATYTQYGTKVGMRAAAVNLIEEIDIAGEWYADKESMKLYYYPPHDLTEADSLEIATLSENFITFSDASYINIDGIEFKGNANSPIYSATNDNGGNGISVTNQSSNIGISDCKLHDIGMDGITIKNSNNINVDGCVIYNTGYRGIFVTAGNRNTQESGNVVISNCHISDVSRDSGANSYVGILLNGGVGTVIENNMFNNMKNSAIRYSGNGHLIRKNEFYNCVNETSDAGTIYSGRSWSEYGTVIQNNYFHEMGADLDYNLANAVFWDDNHSGNSFIGNIVKMNSKVSTSGIQVGGGTDNIVKGNIFIGSKFGIYGEDRTVDIPSTFVETDTGSFYNQTAFLSFKDAADIDYHPYYISPDDWKTAYKTLYPNIMVNFENIVNNKKYTRKNTYTNNIFYNCSTDLNLGTEQNKSSTKQKNYGSLYWILSNPFVNYNGGDYRIKNNIKSRYGLSSEVPDENFNMASIGIQKPYSVSDMGFDLMYPGNNASFAKTETNLKWERVSQADNYTYQVATDADFSNIVAKGTTKYNVVKVTGLSLNTQYYWRVTANNTSSRFGTSKASDSVYTFNTSGEVKVEAVGYNEISECAEFVVSNTETTPETAEAIVAVKAADGTLLGVRSETLTLNADSVTCKAISSEFENVSYDKVECFVWNSVDGMTSMTDKKIFVKK